MEATASRGDVPSGDGRPVTFCLTNLLDESAREDLYCPIGRTKKTPRSEGLPQVPADALALDAMLQRVRPKVSDEDYVLLSAMVVTLMETVRLLGNERVAMRRLRALFGLENTEKLEKVLGPRGVDGASSDEQTGRQGEEEDAGSGKEKPKRKGHGRRSAKDYANAEAVEVSHPSLAAKDVCPGCDNGRLYQMTPSCITKIFGSPLLLAKTWACQRLRCSSCQQQYSASPPEEAEGPKFDASAVSTIAVARYGMGLPMNRLANFQKNMETPVPASTQWEVVNRAHVQLVPVLDEFRRRAAECDLFHIDDTHMQVLEFTGKRRQKKVDAKELDAPERTGLFTTGIVAISDETVIALYRTGRQYAAENLDELLAQRTRETEPVVMSDGLDSRNTPRKAKVEAANCNAHGRRHILEQLRNHPEPSSHYLRELAKVYEVEQACKAQGLSPQQRLARHRELSAGILSDLQARMQSELDEKVIEPNSGLGKAYTYLLKRWDRLTLFLRKEGVPLDNNLVERVLKMVIRHRKNSLFYATQRGADVGDLYGSLIHTAVLNGANAYDYLTQLLRNPDALAQHPERWMPWNYRDAVDELQTLKSDRARATGPPPQARDRP